MAEAKQAIVDYFVESYKAMLEENIDDYVANHRSHTTVN